MRKEHDLEEVRKEGMTSELGRREAENFFRLLS